jgi:tRNA modification GTPase
MLGRDDTIAAIASPPGGGLRGIVRVSGPAARSIWQAICTPLAPEAGNGPSRTVPCVIPVQLRLLPPWPPIAAQICWWPGPRSYTRQPVAELHLPGSPPLLDAVLSAVCQAGARLAEPGEFTLRAFLSGRLDLTQAEAVLGVIDARSRRELDVALEQLAGGLAGPLRDLRQRLLHTLAELEAGLDFVEEDIEFVSARQLHDSLALGRQDVERLRTRLQTRATGNGLPRVVLVGLPNAGKSSLWNALIDEQSDTPAAIVTDQPGTTRDYLEREVDFHGRRCLLVDTAGLESANADDSIGTAAQQVTRQQVERAELRLICRDAGAAAATGIRVAHSRFGPTWVEPPANPLPDASSWGMPADSQHTQLHSSSPLCVWTKSDLVANSASRSAGEVWVSSRTGEGIVELRRMIAERLDQVSDAESAVVAGTAARCRDSLRRAAESLGRAVALARVSAGLPPADDHGGGADARLDGRIGTSVTHGSDEYIAAELRLALDALGQVAGAVHSEDILDVVFSRFCIGK